MGTDITIFVEEQSKDGSWELVDEPVKHDQPYNYIDEIKFLPRSMDSGRNYNLFAILANCRNGLRSEELFKPIADQRGVPDDLSEIAKRVYESSDDYHNATWYYIEEVLDYDWSQTMQFAGDVDEKFKHLFKDNPLGYPRKELERLQNPNRKEGESTIISGAAAYSKDGVTVRWRETYRDCAKHFLDRLKTYQNAKKPLSRRVVMWFSS